MGTSADAVDNEGFIVKIAIEENQGRMRFSLPDGIEEIGRNKGVFFARTQSDIELLKLLGEIEYIEPNYEVTLFRVPNDELFAEQLNLHMVNIQSAWNLGFYGCGVIVGVIDSGVYNHSDLSANILPGFNYRDDNTDTGDTNGHGTFVSGVIAALSNDIGIIGAAHGAKIVPLKCFGTGMTTNLRYIVDAIYGAVDDFGVQIINMSFGLASNPESLEEAVDYAVAQGVIMIAAVGNDGTGTLYFPAAYENVIGVGSVNNDKSLSDVSQRNSSVFVTAPGSDVISLNIGGGYRTDSGTSFAAPLVTGIVAILKQIDSTLDVEDIKSLLAATAEDLWGDGYSIYFGHGLVDVQALMEVMLSGFIPGDINSDGEVDGRDIVYLLRHFAGWPGYELSPTQRMAADVNGDGVVDGRDVIYLMRHFAGWPGHEVLGRR
jgi:thermitase